MPVTPEGFVRGTGSTATGTARSRFAEIGKGRPSPETRPMPYARHMGIEIFVTNQTYTNTGEAVENVIAQWDTWRKASEQARVTVQDVSFEFITEYKMALYVIYSD